MRAFIDDRHGYLCREDEYYWVTEGSYIISLKKKKDLRSWFTRLIKAPFRKTIHFFSYYMEHILGVIFVSVLAIMVGILTGILCEIIKSGGG